MGLDDLKGVLTPMVVVLCNQLWKRPAFLTVPVLCRTTRAGASTCVCRPTATSRGPKSQALAQECSCAGQPGCAAAHRPTTACPGFLTAPPSLPPGSWPDAKSRACFLFACLEGLRAASCIAPHMQRVTPVGLGGNKVGGKRCMLTGCHSCSGPLVTQHTQ